MSTIEQAGLWQQFNLGESNPDPGGGILYALRYATQELRGQQGRVIDALCAAGATIEAVDEQPGVNVTDLDAQSRKKALIMLEELSVVNEALEYHDAGLQCDSIGELANQLKLGYYNTLTHATKMDAYQMISVGIPQIVHDLLTAHAQNNVLSPDEFRDVQELDSFAIKHTNLLGGGNLVVIGT